MEQPRCHQPSPQCPPHHRCHRWPHHAHHSCHNVTPLPLGSAPCMTSWPASVPPSSPGAPVTRTAMTPTCAAETPAVTKHTGNSGDTSGRLHLNNSFFLQSSHSWSCVIDEQCEEWRTGQRCCKGGRCCDEEAEDLSDENVSRDKGYGNKDEISGASQTSHNVFKHTITNESSPEFRDQGM